MIPDRETFSNFVIGLISSQTYSIIFVAFIIYQISEYIRIQEPVQDTVEDIIEGLFGVCIGVIITYFFT